MDEKDLEKTLAAVASTLEELEKLNRETGNSSSGSPRTLKGSRSAPPPSCRACPCKP